MSSELIILFIWYSLIPISIVGYGLFFQKIILKDIVNFNIGYLGLLGIFLLILYSYLSNLFIPHSKIHNTVIIIFGLVIFFINFFFNKIQKEQIKFFYLILFLMFVSILIFKNHDDFEYYHFPYTYLLTQNDLIIGIGNFGHGFRTQSSIFYLNSLFYLPLIDYYLFNLGAVLILFFSNLIFLNYIFDNYSIKNFQFEKINLKYLCLLSFIFVNIFFYRISEHGTDRSSQILIFILLIEVIYFLNLKKILQKRLINIYLLCALVISFKPFYLLYLLIFLPLFIHVMRNKKKFYASIIFFIKQKFFFIFSLFITIVLITNIFNTGCLVYPIYFTCIENFSWSIPIDQVKQMNNWYELWSKAGATPNFRVLDPDEYILNLNWVSNWFNNYFFTKVSDLLVGLLFLSSLVFIIFNKNSKKKLNNLKYFKVLYFLIFILFLEWFFNHPALRYGGYVLFALFFFLPLTYKLNLSSIKPKSFISKSLILIIITISIFIIRNSLRINDEYKKYNYNPFKNTFYVINNKHLRIEKKLDKILTKNNFCKNNKDVNQCLGDINKKSEKLGKTIIENN